MDFEKVVSNFLVEDENPVTFNEKLKVALNYNNDRCYNSEVLYNNFILDGLVIYSALVLGRKARKL